MAKRPPHPSGSRRQPRRKERRALSTTRGGGKIDVGGDAELGRGLANALRAPDRAHEVSQELTHPVHTYPARMHPATARALVQLLGGETLLDPFCGSGTTLVEARSAGMLALGVDANPLAVAIARAKTWTVPAARRQAMRAAAGRIAAEALAEGKRARRAGFSPRRRAPRGVDRDARNRRLLSWWAPHVRAELEYLRIAIEDVAASDAELAAVLEVVLSSILYKVSRRASDTDSRRIERQVGRGAAARLFEQRAEQLVSGLEALARARAPMAQVVLGDARRLDLDEASVDAIVSSPPYAGTYDYAEQHRLRLDFLGWKVGRFARSELGSRRSFTGNAEQRRRALRSWQRTLGDAFEEMARVLRPGGMAAIMMGDSLAGGRAVYVQDTIDATAQRLEVCAWARQARPQLGAAERRAFASGGKHEYIVLLRRAGSKSAEGGSFGSGVPG